MQSWSFELFGFRVDVQPTFLLLLGVYLLFQLQVQEPLSAIVSWALVVFFSILLHELGHALVARRFGLRVGDIVIHGLGGHVTHARTTPKRQLAISLAGPLAGLTVGLVTLGVALVIPPAPGFAASLVGDILFVNIVWSVINLLPMYPLDGGNALRSALSLVTSERSAWRVTAMCGITCGIAAVILGYTGAFGGTFMMFLGGYVTWQNVQVYQQFA